MAFVRSIGVRLLALGLGVSALAAAARADVVTDWNTQYLNTVRVVGGPPCPLARAAAMMHIAMYDALQAIDHQFEPLIVTGLNAPAGSSREAAIAQAARDVMVHLYPARTGVFDSQLNAHLSVIPAGPSRTNGQAVGSAAAAAIIGDHAGDLPFMNDTNYVYENVPGAYAPTYPDYTSPPFSPGWGYVKPWCMTAGNEFRPNGPLGYSVIANLLTSVSYANQYKEVMLYGKRDSRFRSADRTEIAWFWANDRNGTYKPAGHLNAITQSIAIDRHLSLSQNARLFAMINAAMGDAGIVAWDGKYLTDIDLWRPITAIRNAAGDGNPLTDQQPNWIPLLDFSPPFPGYISGHATFGGAWAGAMKAFFGTDNIPFSATSDEPASAGVVRSFSRFSDAGYEDAESRIWLGVHFRCDIEDGYLSGKRLAEAMAQQFFRPVCAADLNSDGNLNGYDIAFFLNTFFAADLLADFDRSGQVSTADLFAFLNAYLTGC